MELDSMVEQLYNSDAKIAYESLKELQLICQNSNELYPYMNEFLSMLIHENSYVRTRGFLLLVANAKWDENNIIDNHVLDILNLLNDKKAITVRQCLKELPTIVKYKGDLGNVIIEGINDMKVIYSSNMQSLIYKDKQQAITRIKQYMFDWHD